MKSILLAVTVAAFLAIMVTGCSPISVTNDYDQSYDFSKLKTFGFIPISAESGIDGINADRLGTAIKNELTTKGYTLSDKADFGVALYFTKKTKTDIQSYGYGYGYGYGWRGVGVGDVTVTQYDEGTLVIDFIDLTDNKLVWRGAGTGTLSDNPSAEERTARINEAVAAIIGQFPPTKEK
jgi:hypothetical protein